MNLPKWLKEGWKEAAIWALFAAFVFELVVNVFGGATVWHRLTNLERSVQALQHERELEEQRTRLRLDDLQEKTEKTEQKVEEKVEKKH